MPPVSALPFSRSVMLPPVADRKSTHPERFRTLHQEMNMLKKAGIIGAVAAAGVLALSGLAFADTTSGNIGNDCEFGNTTGETTQGVFGGSSLLGVLGPVTGVVANAPIQNNLLNCNNVNIE